MDFFFRTFFSGNVTDAYHITSLSYKESHPFATVGKEWRAFCSKTKEHGLAWKTLNYRSDFRSDDGDSGGIVITPSGRMLMKVYFKQRSKDASAYWSIDNVLLFDKALDITSKNGRERTVLTNNPADLTYKEIRSLIIKDIVNHSGIRDDISIKRLVVSDGWARALFAPVHLRGFETEQVILRKVSGKWKIITYGTGTTYNDYPESPYMIWAASDWK